MVKTKKLKLFIDKKNIKVLLDKIYSLVRTSNLISDHEKVLATKLGNIQSILLSWGWKTSQDTIGNISLIEHIGHDSIDTQKMLFDTMAESVKPGSYINFESEEKNWFFDGKKLVEQ